MHDFDLTVSPYNGYMLRNLSKYCLFICCKQSSSTHFCHFLTTAFVTDVLAGSNPMRWAQTKNGPLARTVSNSVVGDEGCPRAAGAARIRFVAPLLACCAGKRFAFPQLRTLSGSNPMRWAQTKNGPLARTVSNSVVGDEGCRVRLRRPLSLRACGPRVLRWKTLARFLSSAPCRVRIPCAGPKKERLPLLGAYQISGGR